MCGICGFIHRKELEENVLVNMNNTIHYRGPNDEGYYLKRIGDRVQLGMAHKRLSILDLSPLGHQPMIDEEKKVVVVFNGEIYNFIEIKKELLNLGYKFKSNSDTEVIVYAYKQWGIDCVKRFNGMFAIALYDKVENEFYLIRDRMGVKPLYYYYNETDLVFASELKPIMTYPYFKKKINYYSLSLYLNQGYITAPNSIFQNTYKLKPAHYLKYKNGVIDEVCYWNMDNFVGKNKLQYGTEQEYLNELEEIIDSSIKYRMISDVPIGAFLSGGIDSSLVAAFMQKNSANPIKTFTIGFEENEYNEAKYAKDVAKHLGTEHYEEYLSLKTAEELLFDMPQFYDEPFADNSQLATYLVSKIAKKQVTVALSGDGGDELFCGYGKYLRAVELQKYKNIAPLINKIAIKNTSSILFNRKINKISNLTSDINIINSDYLTSNLFVGKLLKNKEDIEKKYFEADKYKDISLQEKYMISDINTYLPDDILTKVDRASMAVSLESRNPLLDYRLVEFSMQCPDSIKFNGNPKYLLKELLYKYVPRELIDRPKQGFGVPVHKWLHGEYRKYIDKYLSEKYIENQAIFNYSEIKNLIRIFDKNNDPFIDKMVWKVFVFQLWYDEYIAN